MLSKSPSRAHSRGEATYADLQAVPSHLVAEILSGELITHPRPAPRHSEAANGLAYELTGPFQRGRNGPGGWRFLTEPELHLGPNVVVPDYAAWRVERLPKLPEAPWIEIVPDWVCEIISSSTEAVDRGRKLAIYASFNVRHCWLINPNTKVLEVLELRNGNWILLSTFTDGADVVAAPFDAVPFPLSALWPFDERQSDLPDAL